MHRFSGRDTRSEAGSSSTGSDDSSYAWRRLNAGSPSLRSLGTRGLGDIHNKDTISRNNTEGDEARMAALMARAGQKITRPPHLLRQSNLAAREAKEREAKEVVGRYKQGERESRERREREAEEAVERYKQDERDRLARENQDREERDGEYNRRLERDLIRSGLDDSAVDSILKKEKIKQLEPEPEPAQTRPTYTRMARKHLSIETLRSLNIDFMYDEDPAYFLIKRWVPEWEQDKLWEHTARTRSQRRELMAARVGQSAHRPPEA